MRISELSAATGVSIPVLKLYIRENLLPRGESTSATQSIYGDEHVDRVRLIQALRQVHEMPLSKVRQILQLIDSPPTDIVIATSHAVAALPPYSEPSAKPAELDAARTAVEGLGMQFLPEFPATVQLQASLESLAAAGLRTDIATLRHYLGALRDVAAAELGPMRNMDTADAIEYAVLGTALYEPLILALRRLLHHHLLTQDNATPE